jgi:RHH-type proline utilization regulon transcriptional repressor/proline dehydrogenase/delta 1-pyrroline-5-carboxylate dehydrogenase
MDPVATRQPEQKIPPVFAAPYAAPDEALAAAFLKDARRAPAAEARIDARAARLVEAIRAKTRGLGGIEDFLREYSLSTREGLALMVLAEALLRVPDAATADRLIEDKLSAADWPRPGRSACRATSSRSATAPTTSSPAWCGGSGSRRCAARRSGRCASSASTSCSARRSARR